MRKSRLSAEKRKQILKDYKKMTAKEVAKKHGVKVSYVTMLSYGTKKKQVKSSGTKKARAKDYAAVIESLLEQNSKLKNKLIDLMLCE